MHRGHILVVDDHPDNRQLMTWILQDENYQVTCVGSAEDGLEALKTQAFDAVLMDISLPGMDGKQATQAIRAQPQFAALPIYALTAHSLEVEQKAIIASGVTGLFVKPVDEDRLIQCLAAVGRA